MSEFRVVHGNPSDTELAVVVSLLVAAASASGPAQPAESGSNWGRPVLRGEVAAAPGNWWRSGLARP